jgi:ribonuclease D
MIAKARDRPPHELPETPPRLPRSEAVAEALERLAEVVRLTAERLEIPPPALASRRELKQLLLAAQEGKAVNGASPPPPFDGWRWEILGDALAPILEGIR